MPSLFSSPYRAIQALLNGAREMEKKNMARFQEVMRTMQQSASGNLQVKINYRKRSQKLTKIFSS